jgi:hypothetical protein
MENIQNKIKIEEKALRMAKVHINHVPPYFGQLPDKLTKDPEITPTAKIIYGLMHTYAPVKPLNDNVVVEISFETMMKHIGASLPTVRKGVEQLLEKGWIAKIRQGKMRPNKYRLYPVKGSTFQAILSMKRVQLRIQYDYNLIRKLRQSLYE